jgi:hypothetical protein
MAIINSLMSWIMKKRMHQIELFMKYPNEVQREWFEKLVTTARNTEWGKEYDYASIKTPTQFSTRVPVQSYDDLKPFVDRLKQGEQNLLWPTETKWFAKSSGTTSDKSKFIPVTKEALEDCHYKGGKDMLSIYCNNHPNTNVFNGMALMMGGSSQSINPQTDSYHGDLSAIIIKNLPFWAEYLRTPGKEVALLDNFEDKLKKMTEITINEDVTNLSGVPSWTLILLHKILEKTGKSSILDIWPNLEVFFHGGVNFTPYRREFQKLIPSDKMNYLETYNASEGFFGIQDQKNSDELLLMLDYGIYYEFVPMDQWEQTFPKTVSLSEVELGVNYALLITTNAGLWRYKIGDTIMFTNLHPYRIKISGRTKHFINAFGEEVIIDNAEKALEKACQHTGATIKEYTAGPVFLKDKDAGSHEWIIEFIHHPNSIESFTIVLDKTLQEVNTDYAAKRKGNMALKLPILHVAQEGVFFKWLKSKGKLGGQHKVPRLSNTREYLEEIIPLIKTKYA